MSKLTLDEAIKHCLEVADQNETQADKIGRQFIGSAIDKYATDCRECASERKQLAEWLRELKKAKRLLGEALRTLNDSYCHKDCRQCKWNGNCEMSCRFAWKYGDEASALIGDELNGI